MILEIWVAGKKLDLFDKSNIKHTLQLNDIAELKDRQASFTNSFSIPKTANNKRIFDGLGTPSDTSRIPYTKPNCQMKLEGFDFLTSGWINISDTTDNYKVYIYSGIINFFKAIENKTLGDLDLSEIEHTKNLNSVIASFSNTAYKYLITDYNGLTHYGTNNETINIDYLIPSASIKYLWDKIHSTFGYVYSGDIFDKEEFLNLWLTYPKALSTPDNAIELITLQANKYACAWDTSGNNKSTTGYLLYDVSNYQTNADFELIKYPYKVAYGNTFDNYGYFKAKKKGWYKFDASLVLKNLSIYTNARIAFCFNAPNTTSNEAYNNYKEHTFDLTFKDGNPYTYTLQGNSSFLRYMEADETFCIVIYYFDDQYTYQWTFYDDSDSSLKITRIDEQQTSFADQLKDFSITDFMKEILNHFCLTMFPSEFTPKDLKYLSFKARLGTASIKDWSHKCINRKNEKYVLESYAQKNYFKYQYNDKEAVYHDGSINIDNINLSEKTTLFSSKTYSPEKELNEFYLGSAGKKFLRVFKLYDKNVKEENGTTKIEYKGLDKRFHFVRAEFVNSTVTIGSKTLQDSQQVNSFYIASFDRLDWSTVLTKNYKEMGQIINDSRVHIIDLDLQLMDFLDFDFNSLIYFSQEQQYYFPNKIEVDYDTRKASGEFIRVKMELSDADIINPNEPGDTEISITWGDNTIVMKTVNQSSSAPQLTEILKISQLIYPADDELVSFEWEKFDGTSWTGLGTGITPYTVALSIGIQRFRLKAISINGNIFYSNELQITVLEINCLSYGVNGYGGSGDEVYAEFIDCNGEAQYLFDRAPSPGTFLGIYFCAKEGSVVYGGSGAVLNEGGPC